MDAIKSIYTDLSKEDLLHKCVEQFTQNPNESFNQTLWKYVPKKLWSGNTVFNIETYFAVSTFNDGKSGLIKMIRVYDITPGLYAIRFCQEEDKKRIEKSIRKTVLASQEVRRSNRKRKLHENDDSYVPGGH
ncbi:hypothetical protein TKK_0010243 [Trichogramma kaykai]